MFLRWPMVYTIGYRFYSKNLRFLLQRRHRFGSCDTRFLLCVIFLSKEFKNNFAERGKDLNRYEILSRTLSVSTWTPPGDRSGPLQITHEVQKKLFSKIARVLSETVGIVRKSFETTRTWLWYHSRIVRNNSDDSQNSFGTTRKTLGNGSEITGKYSALFGNHSGPLGERSEMARRYKEMARMHSEMVRKSSGNIRKLFIIVWKLFGIIREHSENARKCLGNGSEITEKHS